MSRQPAQAPPADHRPAPAAVPRLERQRQIVAHGAVHRRAAELRDQITLATQRQLGAQLLGDRHAGGLDGLRARLLRGSLRGGGVTGLLRHLGGRVLHGENLLLRVAH